MNLIIKKLNKIILIFLLKDIKNCNLFIDVLQFPTPLHEIKQPRSLFSFKRRITK